MLKKLKTKMFSKGSKSEKDTLQIQQIKNIVLSEEPREM